MDPPAYTPAEPTPARPHRTIQDLRAQIIANGSVIRPLYDVHKSSDDHIELIVAKTPAPRSASRDPRLHWSEKKDLAAALNRTSDPMGFVRLGDPMRASTLSAAGEAGASGSGSGRVGPGAGSAEKHYAVLMKRTGSNKTIYVIGESAVILMSAVKVGNADASAAQCKVSLGTLWRKHWSGCSSGR